MRRVASIAAALAVAFSSSRLPRAQPIPRPAAARS